jgi:ABC-type bacteriocin/lantibiotic exporter with double-glycine peptidase domain
VLSIIRRALTFMTRREKLSFVAFLFFRAGVSILDLLGILGIGWLGSSLAFSLTGAEVEKNEIKLGSFNLPSISLEALPFAIVVILCLFLFKAISSIALTSRLAHFLARVEARAGKAIVEAAFGNNLLVSGKRSKDEIIYAVQIGSPSAFGGLLNAVGAFVAEGFLFALILTSFVIVDPTSALIAVVYFGFIGFLIQFFLGRLMQRASNKTTVSTVEANTLISDLSDTIREASILGRREFFYEKIYDLRKIAAGGTATQVVIAGLPRYIVESALIAGIALFVLAQLSGGDITASAATIGIFLSGGLRLTASLLPLQASLLSIKLSTPPALRALDILEEIENSISSPAHNKSEATPLEPGPVGLRLEHVDFKYLPSLPNVINDISLDVPAGSQVALIGVSGSGKSTLADLVLGLLDPTSGEIRMGGQKPSQLLAQFPGLVGYVPQNPGLVSGTITQNIALGIDPSDVIISRVEDAVRSANLTNFVDSLPLGLGTDIGVRKDELSGGQLQRIGLARALYTKPKLLVLDEATSALDAESENEINVALEAMRGSVTVIMIAHRLNTVQNSDIVFFMEEGAISARGTFQELVEANQKVRTLANLMAIKPKGSGLTG